MDVGTPRTRQRMYRNSQTVLHRVELEEGCDCERGYLVQGRRVTGLVSRREGHWDDVRVEVGRQQRQPVHIGCDPEQCQYEQTAYSRPRRPGKVEDTCLERASPSSVVHQPSISKMGGASRSHFVVKNQNRR